MAAEPKLIQFFRALTDDELRPFRDFLRSPYFNKHEECLRLGEYLLGLRRDNGIPEVDDLVAFLVPAVWPQREIGRHHVNQYCHQLLRLGVRFLAQRAYETEEKKTEYYHLLGCQRTGLDKIRCGQLRRSRKRTLARPAACPNDEARQYRLFALEHDRFTAAEQRTADPHLQATTDALDRFYLAEKLKLSCNMLNGKLAIGADYEIRFPRADADLNPELFSPHDPASLYARAYALLRTEDRADLLDDYLQAVQSAAARIAPAEITELLNHAINYCARQIRAGRRPFVARLLKLYQDCLATGLLLTDGQLSPWNYKNMVKLGLGLSHFDWVETVVNDYWHRLPPDQRADAYHFSLADLAYHRKDHDRALAFLNRTEFSDIHYALGSKVMLIKIYYETGAEEALRSLLFSFKIYLRRNRKIGAATRGAYLNFVRFTEAVLRRGDQEKLRARIQRAKSLTDRGWLLGVVGNR